MTSLYAYQFPRIKRRALKQFLNPAQIIHVTCRRAIPPGATLILWGSTPTPLSGSNKIIRVEDGFLRSVGLGAYLTPPLSWVFDEKGIYYDPRTPSKLETILQDTHFNTEILLRAKKLSQLILANKLTKYNLAGALWLRPKTKKKVILVPGQVENDASVRFGSPVIKTNLELLKRVREQNPEAYIVYKPHPDVDEGLRRGALSIDSPVYFDELITKASTESVLQAGIDELHTLTSLMGFEALLRDIPVTCYGQPFYAGWGLTKDIYPIQRRHKTLMLNELVAGSLILYPKYLSPKSKALISPEQTIEELSKLRARKVSLLTKVKEALMKELIKAYTVFRKKMDPNF